MVDFCLRFILCTALAIGLVANCPARDNGHTLSMIQGVGGLAWIVRDKTIQQEVSVSEDQVESLKRLLNDKNVFVGDRLANDEIAKSHLQKVLKPQQLDLLRKSYLRRKFRSAAGLLSDSTMLKDLGVDEKGVHDIQHAVGERGKLIEKELDAARSKALERFLAELRPSSVEKFWKLFGTDFDVSEEGGSWTEIAVFPESSTQHQVFLSVATVLPPNLSITDEQRVELLKLSDVLMRNEARGIESDFRDVSDSLDKIISNKQRYALVQRIQKQFLRSDLRILGRPEMMTFLGIESTENLRTLVESENEKLVALEKQLQREAFRKLTASVVPRAVRLQVQSLAEGVWD